MIRSTSLSWFAVTVGLAGPAHAATVKVCAEYQVDYDDADLANYDDAYQGDYFYTNSNKVARGARIRLERVSDGAFQDQFADWEGSDAGCATFTLDETKTFHVRLISELEVNGNTIRLRNDGTNNALAMSTLASNVTFSSGCSTVTYASPTHVLWNVAAAAGHAMWRRHGGLSNKVFDMYWNDNSPCNGGSCHRDGDVWLSSVGRESRFIIVHEIGHAIEYFVSDGGAVTDYESNKGDCFTDNTESHEMQSKEWQSAAIKEGWAHFYAAVAFNQTRTTNAASSTTRTRTTISMMWSKAMDFTRSPVRPARATSRTCRPRSITSTTSATSATVCSPTGPLSSTGSGSGGIS